MRLLERAPSGWDARLAFPTLSTTFAEASRALGFRPFYAEDGGNRALVLMRGLSAPVIGPWTRRAKVNVESTDVAFATELVKVLRRSAPALVRWGDHYWPPAPAVLERCPGMRPVARHIIEQDLTRDEDALFRGMKDEVRRKIRRASKDGVVVTEVSTDADLRDYCRLSQATNGRMEAQRQAAIYPDAFFAEVFRRMVPAGHAVLLLARSEGIPLAAGMFLLGREWITYCHGASTRDRALTVKQGPTAMFWHAMRLGKTRGLTRFSMGSVTPTEDPTHPHYSVYAFKRMWGGTLSEMTSGEIVLSRLKLAFQDRVLSPLWERAYPIYLHGVKSADVKRVLLSALPGLETRIFRRLARQRS